MLACEIMPMSKAAQALQPQKPGQALQVGDNQSS